MNGSNAQNAGTRGRSEYLEVLEAAWADHLKPRELGAPTVVSLFAGCGGSSLGYSMAGYRELLAVEWDANAVATFALNFPDVPVWRGDVRDLSVDECLKAAGLGPGELDVLDGSPPCQGFSTAGRRDLRDPRNELYREYVRLLRGLKPKAFVMENVSGLVKGKMKLAFADCTRELKASGYRVSCRMLDAKWFEVPQERRRLIWIGVREGLNIEPSHPAVTSWPITVREAIGCLPTGKVERHAPQVIEAWHVSRPGQSLRKARRYVGSYQSVRLDPDRPSTTQIKAHPNWHYDLPRYLTIGEAGIIQSFPPSFQWPSIIGSARKQIGNSVPPLMMKAVALRVRSLLAEADGHADQAGAGGGSAADVGLPDAEGEPAHAR